MVSEPRLPHFLIIGAMRSGTTSLYRYIGAHPQVFLLPKEFQFFTKHWDKGVDWYRGQFEPAGRQTVLGEATADYLARQSAMERIAQTLPDVRLIASIRNPVDRAWSHYGLLHARGKESRTFTEALGEELELISEQGVNAPGLLYLSHGLYDIHIERCLALFDSSRLAIVVFEEMVADPAKAYREICSFLEIDPEYSPPNLGQVVNPYITFHSLFLRSVTQKLPDPLARVLGRINTKGAAAAPVLPRDDRDRLVTFYAESIRRTEEILGHTIEAWGE